MTSDAVDDSGKLTALLSQARYILLDFDGPVCKAFAGLPAHQIAADIHHLVASRGFDLPAELHGTGDPLAILRWAADEDDDLAQVVDKALTDAEIRAVATAEPTPGAREFLEACHATGRPVAVVSNNSGEAIRTYLARSGLLPVVAHIEGRDHDQPAQMKPSPHLLRRALAALRANPSNALFVGDSTTDVEAGNAASVPTIGYANGPGKADRLRTAGSPALIQRISHLSEMFEPNGSAPVKAGQPAPPNKRGWFAYGRHPQGVWGRWHLERSPSDPPLIVWDASDDTWIIDDAAHDQCIELSGFSSDEIDACLAFAQAIGWIQPGSRWAVRRPEPGPRNA